MYRKCVNVCKYIYICTGIHTERREKRRKGEKKRVEEKLSAHE